MAVVDRLTDKGVKSDADGDTTLWRDVDYILPFRFLDTPVGCVDELHRPDVHMDGMVHGGDVCQHPFLDASDTDRGVDSLGVKHLAVVGERHHGVLGWWLGMLCGGNAMGTAGVHC